MITNFLKSLLVISVAAVAFSSCSFGGSDIAMASDEGVAKIKEVVKANVNPDKYKIYRLSWKEDDGDRKLDNILSRINVDYLDKEDNSYSLSIVLQKGKFVPGEAEKSEQVGYYSYKLTTPIDLEKVNAGNIRTLLGEGGELLSQQEDGDQYVFKSVEEIAFGIVPVMKNYENAWDGWKDEYKARYKQLKQTFKLNFTKKDEREEVRGKHVWTDYYSVPFVVNEAGKVEIEE